LIDDNSPTKSQKEQSKNKRFCRIDPSSSPSNEEGNLYNFTNSSKKKNNYLIESEINPFVKVCYDPNIHSKKNIIPDYASVEKISHEDDEENESSTKKFLRMKQKMDNEITVPNIMANNVLYPSTISVGDSFASQSAKDLYLKSGGHRQGKLSHKIRKKRMFGDRGSSHKSRGDFGNMRKTTENLSEYKKLLDEAQKLLTNVDLGNEKTQDGELVGTEVQGKV
jgi:hypothetical protein